MKICKHTTSSLLCLLVAISFNAGWSGRFLTFQKCYCNDNTSNYEINFKKYILRCSSSSSAILQSLRTENQQNASSTQLRQSAQPKTTSWARTILTGIGTLQNYENWGCINASPKHDINTLIDKSQLSTLSTFEQVSEGSSFFSSLNWLEVLKWCQFFIHPTFLCRGRQINQ